MSHIGEVVAIQIAAVPAKVKNATRTFRPCVAVSPGSNSDEFTVGDSLTKMSMKCVSSTSPASLSPHISNLTGYDSGLNRSNACSISDASNVGFDRLFGDCRTVAEVPSVHQVPKSVRVVERRGESHRLVLFDGALRRRQVGFDLGQFRDVCPQLVSTFGNTSVGRCFYIDLDNVRRECVIVIGVDNGRAQVARCILRLQRRKDRLRSGAVAEIPGDFEAFISFGRDEACGVLALHVGAHADVFSSVDVHLDGSDVDPEPVTSVCNTLVR